MVADPVLESIQIQTLQNVIRFQDELLNSNLGASKDLYTTWRNECYRLSIQKHAFEDECVALARCLKKHGDINFTNIEAVIMTELDRLGRDHRRRVLERIKLVEDKLLLAQKRMRTLEHKSCLDSPNRISFLTRRKEDLESRLLNVEKEITALSNENSRLYSELDSLRNTHNTPKPLMLSTRRPLDQTSSAINLQKDDEIHFLLAQLKSLEIEAKQMLIKK